MPIWKGNAQKLTSIDLTLLAQSIGCGEDVLHALIEVETRGTGYDKHGRVIMLFEPHKFYKHLSGDERAKAIGQGLAYRSWGENPYPRDSYPRLERAILINEHAAYLACSWGLPQMMGENHEQAGYATVEEMLADFADSEKAQMRGMVAFLKRNKIDVALRKIEAITKSGRRTTPSDWVPVVKPYNGSGYAKHEYHVRSNNAYLRWLKIKDTPAGEQVDIRTSAVLEEKVNGLIPVDDGDASIENVKIDELKAEPGVGGPKMVDGELTADAPAIPITTVTASKESAVKRLWTALGLGGIGLGTFAGKIGGFFEKVDGSIIKWAILLGLGALIVYLVGQFVNGLFDRWSAHKLNVVQAQSAQNRELNTIQFVPPEAGTKE